MGEFETAREEFRGLAQTDPLAGLAGLAELRVRQGRLEEAAQLLAGSEDRAGAVVAMVRLHLARGEVELAAQRLEQRLEAVPAGHADSASLLALRGTVELARGRPDTARTAADALELLAVELDRRGPPALPHPNPSASCERP